MKKQSRKPHPSRSQIGPGGYSRGVPRLRRRSRGGNLLSLIVLIVLILIFMARRIMIAANPRRTMIPRAAASESPPPTGEELSPTDRRALDNLIQNSAHPAR
jgi:hypothetical protein